MEDALPFVSVADMLSRTTLLSSMPAFFAFPERAFDRADETPDTVFYADPRLYYHMDPAARYSLRLFYEELFEDLPAPSIVELCASWASHLPELRDFGPVIGIGLNEEELSRNGSLTAYVVHDLNVAPVVPGIFDAARTAAEEAGLHLGADSSDAPVDLDDGCGPIDCVTCVLGVEYLMRPVEVFTEALRLLRPGGTCIIAFSSRFMAAKAVRLWAEATEGQRLWLAASYLHFATVCGSRGNWRFSSLEALDLSPDPGRSDPLFVVKATKAIVGAIVA